MVSPHGRLFGTNGVRFIPGVNADPGFVMRLSECIGTYFADGEILVGRDGRLSGDALGLRRHVGPDELGKGRGRGWTRPDPRARSTRPRSSDTEGAS